MKSPGVQRTFPKWPLLASVTLCISLSAVSLHAGAGAVTVKTFDSPKQAADALLAAATAFDIAALREIFGPALEDVVLPDHQGEDRQRAAEFVARAREKASVAIDPATRARAFLQVGHSDWPFPIPIVKRGTRWSFDTEAGRAEMRNRRIGRNELDAIEISRGYVEAQHAYALQVSNGVTQYAQRIISTPGTKDGLAWRNADGTWAGPIGESVAQAIERGYSNRAEPYRGYYFKILKGQGPAAPLGQMDFVVKNVMIGGFALVAAPAVYGETGVKTFMVSHDGVVYEKDFGKVTLDQFKRMERFNPDKTWTPVR